MAIKTQPHVSTRAMKSKKRQTTCLNEKQYDAFTSDIQYCTINYNRTKLFISLRKNFI